MKAGLGGWERSRDTSGEEWGGCHPRGLPGALGLLLLSHGPQRPGVWYTVNFLCWLSSCDQQERLLPCSQGRPLFQGAGTHLRVLRHVPLIRAMEEHQDQMGRAQILESGAFLEPQRQELPLHCPSPPLDHNSAGRLLPFVHLRAGLPELTELGVLAPIYSQRN